MNGIRAAMIAAVLAAGGLVFANTRGAAAPTVAVLQQAGDSIQVEIMWAAISSNRPLSGYTVTVRTEVPGWVRESTTTFLSDTLWLPQDGEDRDATVCYFARVGNRTSAPGCSQFVVPAAVSFGAPGVPQVKVISAIGIEMDSITLTQLLPTTPAESGAIEGPLGLATGAELTLRPIGWIGPLPVVCATLTDGRRGWAGVHIGANGNWVADAAPFIPDAGCGWEWISTDPDRATVRPVETVL